jgi:phosphate starvation-inducible protein PhoH
VIIVDEFSNMTFHELDSIITRVGENSRIVFTGDTEQSDLLKQYDRDGVNDFIKIIKTMPSFEAIEFGVDDICRSGLVKEYLLAKHELGIFYR